MKKTTSKTKGVYVSSNGDKPAHELTKREFVAALIAMGFSSNPSCDDNRDTMVRYCIDGADYLLARLAEERK